MSDATGPLRHHDGAEPRNNLISVLIQTPSFHTDDAHLGSRRRLSCLQAQALGVDRVPDIDRVGELDVGPTQIGHGVLTHVDHRQAENQGHGEPRVHDDAPFGDGVALGEIGVEVVLVGIAGQQGEPRGIRFGDRPTEGVLVRGADLEVFEEAAELGGNDVAHRPIMSAIAVGALAPALFHPIHEAA